MNDELGMIKSVICIVYDPMASQDSRARAQQLLEDIKKAPFMNAMTVGEGLISVTNTENERFVGFLIIEAAIQNNWPQLQQQDKEFTKSFLTQMCRLNIKGLQEESYSIKSKMAFVVVMVALREWPQNWSELFPLLAELAKTNEAHLSLVIRILQTLSEEVFEYSESLPPKRRKELKEGLKAHSTAIFELCLSIFNQTNVTKFLHSAEENKVTFSHLFGSVLAALVSVCTWADSEQIAQSGLAPLLTDCLFTPALRLNSANILLVWQSQATTKVVPKSVLTLFHHTAVLKNAFLSIPQNLGHISEEDYFFQQRISQIILQMGMNFLNSHTPDTLPTVPVDFLELMVALFSHPSLVIASYACTFWEELISKKMKPENVAPFVQGIFKFLDLNMRRPLLLTTVPTTDSTFNTYLEYLQQDFEDSETNFDVLFNTFRSSVLNITRICTVAAPFWTLQFVKETAPAKGSEATLGWIKFAEHVVKAASDLKGAEALQLLKELRILVQNIELTDDENLNDKLVQAQLNLLGCFSSIYRSEPDELRKFLEKILNFKALEKRKIRQGCVNALLTIVGRMGDVLMSQFSTFSGICQNSIQDPDLYDSEKIMVLTSWISLNRRNNPTDRARNTEEICQFFRSSLAKEIQIFSWDLFFQNGGQDFKPKFYVHAIYQLYARGQIEIPLQVIQEVLELVFPFFVELEKSFNPANFPPEKQESFHKLNQEHQALRCEDTQTGTSRMAFLISETRKLILDLVSLFAQKGKERFGSMGNMGQNCQVAFFSNLESLPSLKFFPSLFPLAKTLLESPNVEQKAFTATTIFPGLLKAILEKWVVASQVEAPSEEEEIERQKQFNIFSKKLITFLDQFFHAPVDQNSALATLFGASAENAIIIARIASMALRLRGDFGLEFAASRICSTMGNLLLSVNLSENSWAINSLTEIIINTMNALGALDEKQPELLKNLKHLVISLAEISKSFATQIVTSHPAINQTDFEKMLGEIETEPKERHGQIFENFLQPILSSRARKKKSTVLDVPSYNFQKKSTQETTPEEEEFSSLSVQKLFQGENGDPFEVSVSDAFDNGSNQYESAFARMSQNNNNHNNNNNNNPFSNNPFSNNNTDNNPFNTNGFHAHWF